MTPPTIYVAFASNKDERIRKAQQEGVSLKLHDFDFDEVAHVPPISSYLELELEGGTARVINHLTFVGANPHIIVVYVEISPLELWAPWTLP